ncbi:ligA [Symbiodinium sp. CCMP2592]|nr:ligA [Symbiodinium sp. CCMP2592]
MEQLLDSQQVAEHGESRRRQSLQRVHEEGKRVFDELSEKLYTLEVQKADVDEEVGRLQAATTYLHPSNFCAWWILGNGGKFGGCVRGSLPEFLA